MSTDQAAIATIETLDDKDQSTSVRLWLEAIGISTNEEQNWRKDAQNAFDLYRSSNDRSDTHKSAHKKFNILHANIETLCPALFNSTPIPDVRRRFNDPDPIAKTIADLQERCLQYSVESYDFDHVMKLAVSDSEIGGRAVTRVRYKPYVTEAPEQDDPSEASEIEGAQLAYQEVSCEHVEWKHFRRGPGHLWEDVPWIAFELFLTREELEKLSPKFGSQVSLDVSLNRPDDKTEDRNIPEIFKRARVWEIWDKDHRKIIFIAESFKDQPIREEDDPLELEGFYPIPRPLYAVTTSNSLIPIVPYEVYRAQAEELELISERIVTLTNAVKARSLYDGRIANEMERLEKGEDADSVPVENVAMFTDGSKLADHVMFYPIEIIVGALEKLYLARDQIKQTIYEITGISDILRGKSEASETATAQQIKSNWGSLRIQNKQQEIARYARDIFRIKAEIFATKFEPQFLEMMTGIKLMPQPTGDPLADQAAQQQAQAVMQMLRSDKLRGFRVDVESDSTIRADLSRNQQNMTLFLQGTAQFAQAMGPIVMTFKEMTPAVIDVYSAFARNFKLGKQAEDALDKIGQLAAQQAQQPPQPNPQQMAEQQKVLAEQQQHQAEMQQKAQEHQDKMNLDAQKHQDDMALKIKQHQDDMAMREREMQVNAELTKQKQDNDLKVKNAQIEASSKPTTTVSFDANKAVEQLHPAMTEMMKGGAEAMSENSKLIAQAVQSMAHVASALEHTAQVMAADTTLIRDKGGRAIGSKKIMPVLHQ